MSDVDNKSDLELEKTNNLQVSAAEVSSSIDEDDRELEALGYVPSFKREFSNLATVSLPMLLISQNMLNEVIFYSDFRLASRLVLWLVL